MEFRSMAAVVVVAIVAFLCTFILQNPLLHFFLSDKCSTSIAEMKLKLSKAPTGAVKWHKLEEGTKESFTLYGKAILEELFVDDSNKGSGTHYKYSETDIEEFLGHASALIESVRYVPDEKLSVSRFPQSAKLPHQLKEAWIAKVWNLEIFENMESTFKTRLRADIIQALLKVSGRLQNANVVVFGSNTPAIESMVLQFDVATVTTVDYNKLTYQQPKISTLLLSELLQKDLKFDVALSISSFDHDGLARYNDPLDPDGDLKAMDLAACYLDANGIMILSVPVGADAIAWNAGRRYGVERLPLLLNGWQNTSVIGYTDSYTGCVFEDCNGLESPTSRQYSNSSLSFEQMGPAPLDLEPSLPHDV